MILEVNWWKFGKNLQFQLHGNYLSPHRLSCNLYTISLFSKYPSGEYRNIFSSGTPKRNGVFKSKITMAIFSFASFDRSILVDSLRNHWCRAFELFDVFSLPLVLHIYCCCRANFPLLKTFITTHHMLTLG